ncbi:hypothetical protein CPB84DRAFT_1819214 [Gymnopilus junonius]|uniref:Uncharacterized protein n=1 Tax=Gymnopilus junonius TaxID=109634 RepID=A0A9P5TFM2_GYMJU|nr:hypothetical protein CPB84DRAFT_1819214 [Gymnopilus junonius]
MDDAGAPNLFAPFASELDWRVAQWAVKDGPGHNAFNRLLEIPGVVENLGLSYHNIRGLHQKLDAMPEKAGEWKTQNIVFKDKPEQSFMLRYRDPLEAVKSLWRDPQLSPEMVFASAKSFQITSKWWHVLQTQLTQFSGNKAAYPVYLTIGNIPKATRRKPSKHACILIAYLSVQKIDCSRINDQEHHSLVQQPLISAGTNGVKMTSSDGAVRCVHPILTCYVADYPEQCLVACTKYGTCPKCKASAKDLQNPTPAPNRTESWTNSIIQEAKDQANLSPRKFHAYCMSHDVAGSVYKPFWEGFPLCDIHRSITPDVLHQLYQAYGLRPFKNGIFALSQISGMERKNMAKILLGCLVGCMPSQGIAAVTALLDFIYIAQYPAHNSVTLGYLRDALNRFHQNRQYFITTSVHDDFNIPKFHSLLHYIESIELFGTTDNYNTEMFERLHIDFAKHGWRASNQCDEFPQMIRWLSQQEKIVSFECHQKTQPQTLAPDTVFTGSSIKKKPPISIVKHPNFPNRQLSLIEDKHHAPDFTHYLKVFLNTFTTRPIQPRYLEQSILPFSHVNVYNMFRFHPEGIHDDEEEKDISPNAASKQQTYPGWPRAKGLFPDV